MIIYMRSKYICGLSIFLLVLFAVCGCKKQVETAPEAQALEGPNCARNLQILARGKQLWAENNHKSPDDTPTMEDIAAFIRRPPMCPGGGKYTLGKVSEAPTCSIAAHNEAYKKLLANPNP